MNAREEPPKETSGGKSSGFLAFWTTLPGILTGIAALITAIVGLATLVHSWKGNGQTAAPQQTPAATTSSSLTSTFTSSGTLGQDLTGSSRSGPLALRRGDAADLEQGQIRVSATDDIMFGPETTPSLHASGTAFLAPTQTAPTKQTCQRALAKHQDSLEVISDLSTPWICVSTTEGDVAYVEILREPGVGSAKLDLKYAIWF